MRSKRTSTRSDAQTLASRNNSKHSTGPSSDAGKAASSRNSFKHGFTAIAYSTLTPHAAATLSEVHQNLTQELRPAGLLESDLVRRIADESFRIRQIDEALDALKLEGMYAIRLAGLPRGATATMTAEFVAATADPVFQRRLALFLRYKAASERSYYRALAELRRVQKERRELEAEGLQTPLLPSDNDSAGFVSYFPADEGGQDPDELLNSLENDVN
jgi:hypothetical protein